MVLVFGTVCLDRIRSVPRLPAAGGYVEIDSEISLLGGEASNTANALHSWGDDVLLVGNPLGNSAEAELLARLLRERDLPFEPSSTSKELATPVCEIYVTPDGERTMFGRGFAAMDGQVDLEAVPWRKDAWFTADPNLSNTSRAATRRAHKEQMRLYLMDFIRDDDPILPNSFWQSSTDWAGYKNDVQQNVKWVEDLIDRSGCFAILSDGSNGFVAGSPERFVRSYPPFPAPEVVDTTGAGDIFRSGMLHGLEAGWALPDCLRFAAAAGCLKCRHLGATTRVPTLREVFQLINENPHVARCYE